MNVRMYSSKFAAGQDLLLKLAQAYSPIQSPPIQPPLMMDKQIMYKVTKPLDTINLLPGQQDHELSGYSALAVAASESRSIGKTGGKVGQSAAY